MRPERFCFVPMEKTSGVISHAQLARLFRIVLHLQVGSYPRAEDLAALCGVSRRTAYRDLETLASAGVPVRYRADRMGYELDASFWMASPALSDDELHALIVHVCAGDSEFAPEIAAEALHALQKLIAVLPPMPRARGRALLGAVDDERTRATQVAGIDPRLFVAVLGALARQRQVRISYRESKSGEAIGGVIRTKVHPFRLERHAHGWTLVGRSSIHRRSERFRLDRIVELVELDDASEPPVRSPRRQVVVPGPRATVANRRIEPAPGAAD